MYQATKGPAVATNTGQGAFGFVLQEWALEMELKRTMKAKEEIMTNRAASDVGISLGLVRESLECSAQQYQMSYFPPRSRKHCPYARSNGLVAQE